MEKVSGRSRQSRRCGPGSMDRSGTDALGCPQRSDGSFYGDLLLLPLLLYRYASGTQCHLGGTPSFPSRRLDCRSRSHQMRRLQKCGEEYNGCPVEAISFDENGIVQINQESCVGCGICKSRCKHDAIKIKQTMPMRGTVQEYFLKDYNLDLKLQDETKKEENNG